MSSSTPTTQWELLEGAARGDTSARDAFTLRYGRFVNTVARAVARQSGLSEQEVPDLVQEVFLECLKPDGALTRVQRQPGAGFRSYLRGICRNVVARIVRTKYQSQEQQPGTGENLDGTDDDSVEPHDIVARAYAETLLSDVIGNMQRIARAEGPARVRLLDLLKLRYMNGLAPKEIAQKWGCPYEDVIEDSKRARVWFEDSLRSHVHGIYQGDADLAEEELKELIALFP